ncbi:hypothetical protein [Spiroplasma ixodetis]|uniref:Uncharacterized protein n=1 Tax=Spiroplasma ixodetis TaxID=2141 RepID=A0ABN6T586_9MOLU|nr:hypothetical protein [Spiroplasma ixodetis]BDT04427.1 hypothetical protein SHM_20730 [Spiroplasma ixodetis]
MAVPFKQNLDNTEKLVEAPEFIEFLNNQIVHGQVFFLSKWLIQQELNL